ILLIGGIDPYLTEVHGAWIEAVDARPGFAGVGRLVYPAVFLAIGPLFVLQVLALTAIPEAVGTAARLCARTFAERNIKFLDITAALHRHLELVARLVHADDGAKLIGFLCLLAIHCDDHIALFDTGLFGWSFVDQLRDLEALLRRFLTDAQEG